MVHSLEKRARSSSVPTVISFLAVSFFKTNNAGPPPISIPFLCPIVYQNAHVCLPMIFQVVSRIFQGLGASLFARNSFIGIFPIKHNPCESFRFAFGSQASSAIWRTSDFCKCQIGKRDLEIWNSERRERKYDWSFSGSTHFFIEKCSFCA